LIYSHPRPLLMWRLSSSLSSSSTWVMYLNFNEEVTLWEIWFIEGRWNQPCQLLHRQKPASLLSQCMSKLVDLWGNCSDSRYAYSLASSKARPVMTIFVFENTNNGKGTLRSILNVGYVVGMKGRRERQALCCSGCTVELQLVWPKISRSRAWQSWQASWGCHVELFLCP
jgi:hypothetical protein